MGKYAIFIVLALTVSLFTYGRGIQNSYLRAEVETIDTYERSQARNLAQSAASVAVRKLLDPNDDDFRPATNSYLSFPLLADSFLTWADMGGGYRLDIVNQGDSLVLVHATGRFDDKTYRVDVTLSNTSDGWNPDFPHAVFANTNIRMEGSARIVGNAGTNSTANGGVNLAWSTGIDSALVIGPGGNPATVVNQANFISGNVGNGVTPLSAPKVYTLPDYPAYPAKIDVQPSKYVVTWPPSAPWNPSDYDGKYFPELRVTENVTFVINVGDQDRVLHVGNLNIQQGNVQFIGTGKITIYAENNITLNGSSTINANRGSETMFTFYGGSNAINFAGATVFRGGIYAQQANVVIGGSGGVTGHILTGGTSVVVSGDAYAHTRILFAPNAYVQLTGSGRVRGPVVADRFYAEGNTRVFYSMINEEAMPEFGGGESKLIVRNWR